MADTVEWPLLFDVTSDFVYCRLRGSEELYVSGYEDDALDAWARRGSAWTEGREPRSGRRQAPAGAREPRDVFVYFGNDARVGTPADARRLMEMVEARRRRVRGGRTR